MPLLSTAIKKGASFGHSGHLTYWAHTDVYPSTPDTTSSLVTAHNSNAIYKANKNNNPYLSELEVGASAVWEACIGERTTRYDLVIDEKDQALGVTAKKLVDWQPFDDKFKFDTLNVEHKQQLAELLVYAYCLEEDDLHRNNFGFATVNGKQQMVKIDHDMSFYQSVTSASGNRRGYIRVKDEDRFIVSAQDIDGFPDLQDANIHYWPTKYRLIEGSAGYSKYKNLRQAFLELKNDEIFKRAKFTAFFNFINLPPAEIKKNLMERLGPTRPEIISMMVDAFIARQAEIRVFLLTTPGARKHLESLPFHDPIRNTFLPLANHTNPIILATQTNNLKFLDLNKYKSMINIPDDNGKTALDYAYERYDVTALKKLLEHGATCEPYMRNSIENFLEEYHKAFVNNTMQILLNKLSHQTPLEVARAELASIRDNLGLSLSEKKMRAVLCVQVIAGQIKNPSQLHELFDIVNNREFNFIRQLTSKFWIVRQIRGSHGVTSSYKIVSESIQNRANELLESSNSPDKAILNRVLDKAKSSLNSLAGILTTKHSTLVINQVLTDSAPVAKKAMYKTHPAKRLIQSIPVLNRLKFGIKNPALEIKSETKGSIKLKAKKAK